MRDASDTARLQASLRAGDREAFDRVIPEVYEELRRIAHRELSRRSGPATIQTTGLVHEAYLKLASQGSTAANDRAHFLALAGTAMRHIVIDYARSRATRKRGGGWARIPLDQADVAGSARLEDVIELDEALKRLERFDELLCQTVECRFFGGLTVEETALALDVAPRTVDRAWARARAWLYREMQEGS